MLTCGLTGYLNERGKIDPLGAAWAITVCRMPVYWRLLAATIFELQQNGLQDTTQVVRQLEVQVPKTAGGTPATNSTCLRFPVRKSFSYLQETRAYANLL